MRRLIALLGILLAAQLTAAQEPGGWCGYALIEGLPLLENQLTVLAAITPARNANSKPNELFQYRFNSANTAVIVEGCWRAVPTRDMVIALLAQAFRYDDRMLEQIGGISEIGKPGEPVDTSDVVRAYIDQRLVYTIFAPGGSANQSAAAVRDYLASNISAWELPEQEVVCDRAC